jgi:hypothetical protein
MGSEPKSIHRIKVLPTHLDLSILFRRIGKRNLKSHMCRIFCLTVPPALFGCLVVIPAARSPFSYYTSSNLLSLVGEKCSSVHSCVSNASVWLYYFFALYLSVARILEHPRSNSRFNRLIVTICRPWSLSFLGALSFCSVRFLLALLCRLFVVSCCQQLPALAHKTCEFRSPSWLVSSD